MERQPFIKEIFAYALDHYDFVIDDLNKREQWFLENTENDPSFYEIIFKDPSLTEEAFILAEKLHNMN
jgi:hypothetical protein